MRLSVLKVSMFIMAVQLGFFGPAFSKENVTLRILSVSDAEREFNALSDRLGRNVVPRFAPYFKKMKQDFGIEAACFFMDAKTSNKVSGRIFYTIDPGKELHDKGIQPYKAQDSLFLTDQVVMNTIAKTLLDLGNPNSQSNAVVALTGVLSKLFENDITFMGFVGEFEHSEACACCKTLLAGNAPQNLSDFLVGQAAFRIIDISMRNMLKELPPAQGDSIGKQTNALLLAARTAVLGFNKEAHARAQSNAEADIQGRIETQKELGKMTPTQQAEELKKRMSQPRKK